LGDDADVYEEVSFEDLEHSFTIGSMQDVIEHDSRWPTASAANHVDFEVSRVKGLVFAALGTISEIAKEQAGDMTTLLDIFSKPVRRVTVNKQVRAGGVFLPPISTTLRAQARTGPFHLGFDSLGLIEVQVQRRRGTRLEAVLPGYEFKLQVCFEKKIVWPLWALATSSDKAEVNLDWVQVDVPILSTFDYQGSVPLVPHDSVPTVRQHGKKTASAASGSASDALPPLACDFILTFACLVNRSTLKAGTPLVAYRPPAAATKREVAPITIQQARKAARKA
jgi:hypothetical protein